VIRPENTSVQHPIKATTIGDVSVVTDGLAVGERVVVNGQYRLQAGIRVQSSAGQAATHAGKAS